MYKTVILPVFRMYEIRLSH